MCMTYTIRALAELAGVSTRTLRWYDQVGLLSPSGRLENGYRLYTGAEVNRLQQILYYRALGLGLAQIRQVLENPAFDRLTALRGQLTALERERTRMDALIAALRRTIDAEERKEPLMDQEKFEVLKRNTVSENEARYGAESRRQYGDHAVDASNARLMNMTPEAYDAWNATGDAIRARLEAAVMGGKAPSGAEGQAIAALHRQWLGYTWATYTPEAHAGLAEMYVQDERFLSYYDCNVPGCAAFLRDAVKAMVG